MNLASIVVAPLAVGKTSPKLQQLADSVKRNKVKLHEVGTANDLQSRSETGDGLDVHHAPQKQPASQVIPGYDPKKAPAIAVAEGTHTGLNQANLKGATDLSPRDLMAKTARDLRNEGVANSAVREVIDLAKKLYPILER